MKTVEENLKELIMARYGTMIKFSTKIGMSNSTLAAIINRGVNNASVTNIIKICEELDISADALAGGQIVPNSDNSAASWQFSDVAELVAFIKASLLSNRDMTLNGEPLADDDLQCLIDGFELSCEMVRRKMARSKE